MTADPGPADARLAAALSALQERLGGTLGVAAMPLGAHPPDAPGPVAFQERLTFPAASTIKVFVLQALLERVAHGTLTLDQELTLQADDQVTGSGVLKVLSPGRRYTLRDLATLMIVVSDNTATNLLIDLLGVDRINDVIRAHGWHDTWLAGPLQRPSSTGAPPSSRSTSSPADLADAFRRLWAGELLPAPWTQLAQAIYRRQQLTDGLGRYLPFDRYATETGASDLTLASKSGSLRGVRNDAGVVERGVHGYVVAIMTKDCPDARFHPDNLGSQVLGEVSRLIYKRFLADA